MSEPQKPLSQTTLKERIARALNEFAYAPQEESWAKDKWRTFLPLAEAVLAAIREPTERMELAGHNARSDKVTGLPTYCGVDEIWTAMIDAALQERPDA